MRDGDLAVKPTKIGHLACQITKPDAAQAERQRGEGPLRGRLRDFDLCAGLGPGRRLFHAGYALDQSGPAPSPPPSGVVSDAVTRAVGQSLARQRRSIRRGLRFAVERPQKPPLTRMGSSA